MNVIVHIGCGLTMMESMTSILRVGFLGGNGFGTRAVYGQSTGDVTKAASTR
jgi:hypothetical protein